MKKEFNKIDCHLSLTWMSIIDDLRAFHRLVVILKNESGEVAFNSGIMC